MHIWKKKNGSVLIEAMTGLTLVILSFGGIIGFVSRGLRMNTDMLNKFVAINLAAEGVELIKNSLDVKWDAVKNGMYEIDYQCFEIGKSPCAGAPAGENTRSVTKLKRSASGVYSYEDGEDTAFSRSIVVNTSGDSVKVYSIVRWDDRGSVKEVQVADIFWKWRKDPQ